MNKHNWTVVILGASGDLAKRKLLPALCDLIARKEFDGTIVGTGREETTAHEILQRTQPFIKQHDANLLEPFFTYQKLEFSSHEDFVILGHLIGEVERKKAIKSKRLIYLATSAHFFCEITNNLVASGIVETNNLEHVVVYEKPFGWDVTSAKTINTCISKILSEDQVYRIDHYLAKEFVSNIVLLRYSNSLFKTIWDNHTIDSIKILFTESIGLEGRGSFYDSYGVLKDVVQNHVLQILALVTMQAPSSLNVDAVRDKKASILKAVHVEDGVLGQFEGYLKEPGVARGSRTATFAALKLFIDVPEWQDVPIYLEAGKALEKKTTQIQLILKPVPFCLWSESGGSCANNILTIHITPDEGFSLRLNTKRPGTLNAITTVLLDFKDKSVFGPTSAEAYEILLKEIMAGNHSLSVRFDEIEYQWSIIDAIYAMHLPLLPYKKGSQGPEEAVHLMNERLT